MPHTLESIVDILHDLRGSVGPAKLKELLPDVASIAVNDRLRDAAEELVNHDLLVVLGDRIECLLDNMAAKGIHREIKGIAPDSLGNLDDLLSRTVLEASLDKEISEAVHHQRIGLGDDGLNNLILLLGSTDLELLLKEDGSLLVIIANDLVNDVLPVAIDVAVEEASIVERLGGRQIGRSLRR